MNHIGITAGASTPDWIIQEVVKIMENLQAEGTEVMSEELLDKYDYEENPKKGDVVKGTVISVNDDAAYVSIGTKAEAILPKKEMAVPAPEKASDFVKVGDELTVEIANNIKEEGAIVVSLVKMKKSKTGKKSAMLLKTTSSSNVQVKKRTRLALSFPSNPCVVLFPFLRAISNSLNLWTIS